MTPATPSFLPEDSVNASGERLCWKRTCQGWVTVPAPWGDDPNGWLWRQPKRCVYAGGCKEPSGMRQPSLQVWEVSSPDATDVAPLLVCDLISVVGHPVNVWSFLCDLPALPQLVAEFEPMLRCVCERRKTAPVRATRPVRSGRHWHGRSLNRLLVIAGCHS